MKKLLLTACALILGWGGVDAAVNPCIKLDNEDYKENWHRTKLYYRLSTPMEQGKTYTLTMRVYFENPLCEPLCFWPYKDGGKTLYTAFDVQSFNPGVWTTVTCNFNAEDNYDALQFPLGHVDGVMRIDDVKLVAEDSPTNNLVSNGNFSAEVKLNDGNATPGTWYTYSWEEPLFTYEANYDDAVGHEYKPFVLENYAFTPVTIAKAAAEQDNPIVLMSPDGNVLTGKYGKWGDGIKVSSQIEFYAKNYQLQVEPIQIDGAENAYTIKLNEDGNYIRYLQASMWGHAFLSGNLYKKEGEEYVLQQGQDGQNGAVWTVASEGVNTYSLRSLGVEQNKIGTRTDGYLKVSGSDVRIDSEVPVAWTFATCVPQPAVVEARTLSVNRILDFTNVTDVDAYIATGIAGNKVTMRKVTGAVPANTGLVLIPKNDKTSISIPTCGGANVDVVDVSDNKLVANRLAKQVPEGAYVLAGSQQTLGWYSVAAGNIPTLPAGKCYLNAPQAGVKSLVMSFDEETTSIAEAEVQREDAVYHNLQGMRVSKPTTGIYITRGKKVIINK